ncbi:hypothetical protein MAM1_0878d11326 [Mucor ambiguus]|uniref:Uncharacterized protein n=1 Tax=Mucor ambiguus TaxID=91626 RepID=A0A0C9MLS5_9FUNG|nr:hypothetical protein MAM1_0878d11326 [Mucor ambiguus]
MIQVTVAIETTIKALDYVNMPLSITTNVSFEDENEEDTVDSSITDDSGTTSAVETTLINGHAEQDATDDVVLSPTAKFGYI